MLTFCYEFELRLYIRFLGWGSQLASNYADPPHPLHHEHIHKSNLLINEVFLIGVNATTVKKYFGKYLRSLNRWVYGLFNDKKWKQRERRKLYSNTTKDNRTQCRTIVTAGAGLWKQSCADERIFPQAIYIPTDSRAYLFSVFPFPFIRNKLMTK